MSTNLDAYTDCEIFKPGERWRSPRGIHYIVQSCTINGVATLRIAHPDTRSRLRYLPWDGVMNWVRIAAAPANP